MKSTLLIYQQKVFRQYSSSIGLPKKYTYPDGNSIRSLPPILIKKRGLMIVGAYPSARFENRKASDGSNKYRLVPIADNLQPFGDEEYFDGLRVRKLESGSGLREYLLDKLDKKFKDYWITDLVKVFLYKKDHLESCKAVDPSFKVAVFRDRFYELSKKSLPWLREEIELCNPKLIVTLGREVAQVVSGNRKVEADEILRSEIGTPENANRVKTVYAPHPDACRRFEKWRKIMEERVALIKKHLDI